MQFSVPYQKLLACVDCLIVHFQVAVFVQGVDTSATETKGTVLIHSADQVSL